MPHPWTPAPERYASLPFRRAGRSGLDLPVVSLGLWQGFGTDRPADRQREVLLHAVDLGVVHVDLANRYGPPPRAAEEFFGRVLETDLRHHRDELVVSTKAGNPVGPGPYLRGSSRKTLLASLERSLRDLRTDHVDVFYSHRHDPTTPLEETAGALVHAVESGRARYVGVSNYPRDAAAAIAGLLRGTAAPLLLHQPRYSLYDRRIETEGVLEQSAADGVGLVTYSPLAQGLLTDKYLDGTVPAGARAERSAFLSADDLSAVYLERTRALDRIARDRGQSLAQLALQWVLRRPEVTSALLGASSTAQLDHNLRALDGPAFTAEELRLLDEHGVHGTGLRL